MAEQIYTLEQVIDAFEGSAGVIVNVANKLGVSHGTIYNYMKQWPELEEVRQKARVALCSDLENVVITSAKNGKTEDARWLLNKLDRNTYGDKTDINITSPTDNRSLSDIIGPITDEERIKLREKFFGGSNETNTGSNESK